MTRLLDAMRAIMRADADRLAPRIAARQIEELRAAPDGCARVNVQPVRGSLPDVPVERFRYVHRNATAKQPEHGYVEPVDGPVPTAEWIEQNRGIASKGLPTQRKRMASPPIAYGSGLVLGVVKQVIRDDARPCGHGCASGVHTLPVRGLLPLDRDWSRMVDPLTDTVPAWLRILMGPYWHPPVKMARKAARPQRTYEEKAELIAAARKAARKRMGKRGIAR